MSQHLPFPTTDGADLIRLERLRQIHKEHRTREHDAQHTHAELVRAAICYAATTTGLDDAGQPHAAANWPFESTSWKPSADPLRNLVKAGALIAAEIDRRLALTPIKTTPTQPKETNHEN